MPQTNVKTGPIAVMCGEDLTNATDLLVRMSHAGGTPVMILPFESRSEPAMYLVLEGAAQGELGSFMPLNADKSVRVPILGTCDPGDRLMIADPEIPGRAGKVEVLSDAPGSYRIVGIAEEAAVDGQLVLIRPLPYNFYTVT